MAVTTSAAARTASPAYQGYQVLHVAFTIAPIIAGLDKFLHLLTNWDKYLSPLAPSLLHVAPHTFMLGVGVVEIIAGLLVAAMPAVGAWIVGVWLLGIVGNLLMMGSYLDVALRDFGLALGSFALARIAQEFSGTGA